MKRNSLRPGYILKTSTGKTYVVFRTDYELCVICYGEAVWTSLDFSTYPDNWGLNEGRYGKVVKIYKSAGKICLEDNEELIWEYKV